MKGIAAKGHQVMVRDYSKARQWQAFQQLIGAL